MSLFQDSQVCREVGIKYAVESQTVQCSGHLSFYNGSNRKSEAFAQTHTNGRCCLNDNELIRIFQCSLNLSGRILLIEGAHRASCHALSAVYAAGLCKRKVKGTSDVCIESTVVCADYADSLKVFTGSHASSAKNTFVVVSDDGFGAGIYAKRILLSGIVIRICHAVALAQLLQLAVVVSYACQTVHVVIGNDQLQGLSSGFSQSFGISVCHHSVTYRECTSGYQTSGTLHFTQAHSAGANFVDVSQIAQSRNVNSGCMCSIQKSGAFRNCDFNIIDC